MKEGELESVLQTLREEIRGKEAPPRVEAALLAAFRARVRVRRRWTIAGLAAAAALVLMAGSAAWWMSRPVAPPVVRVQHPFPPEIPVAAIEHNPVQRSAARPVRRAVRPRPKLQEEVTTEFLPLDETAALAPIESGQVVRVQLPRSTMIRFGFPMNPDRMMEPVQADVVFAQDGIARAVRFVK